MQSRPLPNRSAMLLAHHHREAYERCALVGGRHVCRRCLVLYPIAFAVMLLTIRLRPPYAVDIAIGVLAPLPGVFEYVADALGKVRYNPRRQVLMTLPLAAALGRGFARYLNAPGDPLFWAIVVVYGGICGIATLVQWKRAHETSQTHEATQAHASVAPLLARTDGDGEP